VYKRQRLGLKAHPARLFEKQENGDVICGLSPRRCRIKEGQAGFCQVRKNEGGQLVTLNYGVSVEMTQESIETEAIAHYSPGSAILSLGNIGCMLACDFCHNWKTSQLKHVEKRDLHFYTPEQVVQSALERNIPILSWTYNDPVVWQEFVLDTARLAQKNGILNLYKSAFSITPEAIDELHSVIDIFSISLKSLDPVFYKKVAKGELEPVLEAIRHIYLKKDRHLELSNLLVTGRNDNFEELEKTVNWILKNLDENVPLHLVRFHPDYRYTHVDRTSIPFLKLARKRALEMGMKHVYLGNVYEEDEGMETHCLGCGALQVRRFGLHVEVKNLSHDSRCEKCGVKSPVVLRPSAPRGLKSCHLTTTEERAVYHWSPEHQAAHVQLFNSGVATEMIAVERIPGIREPAIFLKPGEPWRMIVSRQALDEQGFRIVGASACQATIQPILDRAHFPSPERTRSFHDLQP
jgi:pyruvate formate lyase activating enzyme